MKIIPILFIIALLLAPVFVSAGCSKTGTTVVFINGIFGDKNAAKQDKDKIEFLYNNYSKEGTAYFFNGFNASHIVGVGDIANAILQAYGKNGVDYDLTNILLQLHKDLKTQNVLLVGHSQGTFYTNATYDYLVKNGIDKNSIAVYNIATPASSVAGGGKYLTSSTDEVINSIVSKLAVKGKANKPLPANIDIKIPKEIELISDRGHSFSKVYLALAPDRIIGDMDEGINNLKPGEEKSECFTAPTTDIIYNIKDNGYKTADQAITYFGQSTTSPFQSPEQLLAFASGMWQNIYNFGRNFVYGIGNIFAGLRPNDFVASTLPGFSTEESASSNILQTPLVNADLVDYTGTGGPDIPDIILPTEISQQDLLDDIQEKIDILRQQIQELVDQQNQNDQPAELDLDKEPDDETNQDANKKTTKSSGGVAVIYPKILISEVQTAGTDDEKQEFVELYNPNNQEVDLTDWYLQRKTANGQSWSTYVANGLFSGKKIPANGYFLIARSEYYIGIADIYTDNSITNDNSFALKNPNGEISDKLGFGNAIDPESLAVQNPGVGQSIGRKVLADGTEQESDNNSNDFELQKLTPKYKNEPANNNGDVVVNPVLPSITNYTLNGLTQDVSFDPSNSEQVTIVINASDPVKFNRIYICPDSAVICDSLNDVKYFTQTTDYDSTVSKIWDGKASGGEYVSNGTYKIGVQITDASENQVSVALTPYKIIVATVAPVVVLSNDATITSTTYTVNYLTNGAGTIINVPFAVSKATFESALIKNQADQVWDDSAIADPVVSGNTLVATAQDGITKATYTITVATSNNFVITPDCVFSSPDISNTYGNVWSVVGMCNCSSPAWSDSINSSGINMKANCGWNSSTNMTCNEVKYWQLGSKNEFYYQTIYIIKGVCSTSPSNIPIDAPTITGIRVPVIDAIPVTQIINSEYTATVAWAPNDTIFSASTIYTATISITPKTDYTLNGVVENFFTVAGTLSPATNSANSGVVTATFPATAAIATIVPSNNFTITPDCVFSSPDISNAYGKTWSVVGMCNCSSPAWSDSIETGGMDMKASCGLNNCSDTPVFLRGGNGDGFSYPTVYVVDGVCSTTAPVPPPPIIIDDNEAPVAQLKIITSPQTIGVDIVSGIFTVESQNGLGVKTNVASSTIVNLSSSSPTGMFSSKSASECGDDWTKTNITISKGDAHRSFCYKDSTAGAYTITVSADGMSSDSQAVSISP